MFDEKKRYIIENFDRKPVFSSFLPGISGRYGIPIWCYYVNRGQAVTSFGSMDKDHAIMEFSTAHQAFQSTARFGFRTFVRADGRYFEPFSGCDAKADMFIGKNELEIKTDCSEYGLSFGVRYCVLPNERIGALLRRLEITNTGDKSVALEIVDGMPAVIPYGVGIHTMKMMTQTGKAWMRAENKENGMPYFKISASMDDSAAVRKIANLNFAYSTDEAGKSLFPIVDPETVFGYDTTFETAVNFRDGAAAFLEKEEQITVNRVPSAFFLKKMTLGAGQKTYIYEVIGQAENAETAEKYKKVFSNPKWYEEKFDTAAKLTDEICAPIKTRTANGVFDEYCEQTFLDNVLRGGRPELIGKDSPKVFSCYSRKHGDPERDYNYFKMSAEYYSQGNGNYRDVNQNRRSDVLFYPEVAEENVKQFFSLVQIDGYNPLSVDRITYKLEAENIEKVVELVFDDNKDEARKLFARDFTPGEVAMAAERWTLENGATVQDVLDKAVDLSISEVNATFGEGYWSDHWTYNLDLVESFLRVYPDRKEEILFEKEYPWFDSKAKVLPRSKRYVLTADGRVRQYGVPQEKKNNGEKWMKTGYGSKEVALSTVAEKLFTLCAVKFATLDPYGMGVEMEGGKPGWYDALNGLPGIFGSSMPESCELARTAEYLVNEIKESKKDIEIFTELNELVNEIKKAVASYKKSGSHFELWDMLNCAREKYVAKTADGVDGAKVTLTAKEAIDFLSDVVEIGVDGIEKAKEQRGGICPTYFYYDAVDFDKLDDGSVKVKKFEQRELPLFLEGATRWLKTASSDGEKLDQYERILKSDLYDKKLGMYKVSASLKEATYEVGRAAAFTAGWLENESIWLHMEYKYLLELLKNGMYEQFSKDFKKAAVPFLDDLTYGRSPLENSSFLASSANPDSKVHGRGFVARLSGSTAEFLDMWQLMMFGDAPFKYENGELEFEVKPFIPEYLIPDDNRIEAMLLGTIAVEYITGGKLIPGSTPAKKYELLYTDGHTETVDGKAVVGAAAADIRGKRVNRIKVWF